MISKEFSEVEKNVAEASVAFALRLFQEASRIEGEKNLFLSPLSYMQALTMTANGAAGETLDGMRKALQISHLPMEEVNDALKALTKFVLGLDFLVEINIANGIWYNSDFTIVPAFLSNVVEKFGAELRAGKFGVDAVKDEINVWVEKQTNKRIMNLITEEFESSDIMCLVNAVYFNAEWSQKFKVGDTKDEFFVLENDSQLPCKMMKRHENTNVAVSKINNALMAELSYGFSRNYTMILILPDKGERLSKVIAEMTAYDWNESVYKLQEGICFVELPKFRMQTRYEEGTGMQREFHTLGMAHAFSVAANFTNLVMPPANPYISKLVQQTFLQVDERGTEAAAATAVIMSSLRSGMQPTPPTLRFDRPFAFFIREKSTNMILFAGSLYKPEF